MESSERLVFTYDEVVECVRKKKAFWSDKAEKVFHVEDSHKLYTLAAACDFIIQDIASLALEKQAERLNLGGEING